MTPIIERRRLRVRRALLCMSTVLCTGLAAPAYAQTPSYRNLDGNGVDLTVGDFVMAFTEGSIGSGQAELSMIRQNNAYAPSQWDGFYFIRSTSGSTTTYRIGQSGRYADTFTGFVADKANGATLAATAAGYLYTTADGTKITFIDGSGGDQGYTNFCGSLAPNQTTCDMMPSTITYPNGSTVTLTYQYYRYPGVPYGTTPTNIFVPRLKTIANNLGYRITIGYSTLGGGSGSTPPPASWYERLNAKFFNTAISPTTVQGTVSYAYPSSGTTDITDFTGNVWRVTATSIRRPGEVSPSFSVGGSASAVTSVTRDGVTTSYARTVSGSTATMVVTGAAGSPVTTIVSNLTIGRPISVADTLGKTVSYSYDANGRLTQVTQPEGNYVNYTLDGRGNATQIKVGGKTAQPTPALVTNVAYDTTCANPLTCNQPNSITTPLGRTTDFTYDSSSGQIATVTRPAPTTGGTRPQTRYSYTLTGGIYMLTGISACQTGSAPSCVGTADEVKTAIVNDTNGNVTSISTGAGNGSLTATTTATYTPMGDLLTSDGPLSGTADTMTYRYDAARRQVGTIDPDPDGAGSLKRRAFKTIYDIAGRPTQIELGTVNGTTDPDWTAFVSAQQETTTYTDGRPSKTVLTSGGTTYGMTQFSYDANGRIDCTAIRMNSATWASLPASACTLQTTGTAGSDRIAKTGYDTVGRVNKTTSAYGTADASDDMSATFTDNGKLATLTDANGNKTTYNYDRFDRLTKTQYPSPSSPGTSSTTDYDERMYDTDSKITSFRLRGYAADSTQHVDYTYDNADRVTLMDLPGTIYGQYDRSYSYDNLNRATAVNAIGGNNVSFGYDALSRKTSEQNFIGTKTYQYDLAGRRIRLTWPDSFYVTYDYDVTGNMTAIRESGATSGPGVLATYSYDDLGRRTGVTRGNGTGSSFGYDPVSRLSSLTQDLSGTTNDLTIGHSYNPASQIATNTRSNDLYAFGGYGNRNQAETPNGLNQLTAQGGTSLIYDARGNVSGIGAGSFTYTADNVLTYAPGKLSLEVDSLNRPVQSFDHVSGLYTRFDFDGLDMIGEHNGSNVLQRRYVFGPGIDEPIVWYEGSGTTDRRWLHGDERGSIIAVSNGSGAVTNINSYDEYGVPAAGNVGRFQYTGQAWLPELGMYYYKARIYNPGIGRFMQTDPIGYAAGMNLYAYVAGDPVNLIDPMGLDALCGKDMRASFPKRPPRNQTPDDVNSGFTCVPDLPEPRPGGERGSGPLIGPKIPVEVFPCRIPMRCATPPAPPQNKCPAVPEPGPGREALNQNIADARKSWPSNSPLATGNGTIFDLIEESQWVTTSQNYKSYIKGSAPFGNFNFGATMQSRGFSRDSTIKLSNAFQMITSFRQDPAEDVIDVANGWTYAANGCDKAK